MRTCKTYQVEYGSSTIIGWEEIQKFLRHLSDMQSEGQDGIWISENEEEVEINFALLEQMKTDKTWGKIAESILEEADRKNDFAHLSIF